MADELKPTGDEPGAANPRSSLGSRPRVLLVDDDPTTRNLISHFLGKEGILVEKALTGSEGLARARELRPDLLIVDAAGPALDGGELLSLIRKDPAIRDLPVLVLSSLSEEDAIIRSLDEGADYVIKPFSPRILAAMVRKILREADGHAVHRRPL